MYTRASPYGFGIMAFNVFLRKETFKSKMWAEYVSLVFVIMVSYIGAFPTQSSQILPPFINFLWITIIARSGFGLCVSYLMLSSISEPQALSYPSYWLKRFLSLDCWVPLASISFSMYLFHPVVIQFIGWIGVTFLGYKTKDKYMVDTKSSFEDKCLDTLQISEMAEWSFIFFIFLFITCSIAVVVYVFVEKPAIDARRVYKNKYSKTIKS